MTEKRVQFDFEIEFSNGGGLKGEAFRLDIDGDDITDEALADAIVRDMRLLMVGAVRIRNKAILVEPHKRSEIAKPATRSARFVDLSHTIEDGMITYKGLPAPLICDHLSRVDSRALYAPGTEFQIGRITMVANTGTYIDAPFHRYADGHDIAGFEMNSIADVDAIVVHLDGMRGRSIARAELAAFDVAGKAVLVHTNWSQHWRTDAYFENHPFLTADAAAFLRDAGARLVGIDSFNIDDTSDRARPVHTILLGAGIPIVEHLTALDALPASGFRFSAVPPKVRGLGTFPVRVFATLSP